MSRFTEEVYSMGFEGLIKGIIKQAVLDWLDSMYKLREDPNDTVAMKTKSDVERFFKSEWYVYLCNIDGKKIMQLVEEAFYKGEFDGMRKNKKI